MSIQTVEIALPSGITIVEIRQGPAGPSGAGEWGDIGGTITDQTDLVSYIGTRLASGEATAKNVEVFVRNVTGATIAKGSIVYINGASGQRPTITKAQANNDANPAQTIGFVKADIANNGTGYVITSGDLENVDTQALEAGDQLYLSPDTAGAWTTDKPSAPQHLVYVGIVVSAHPTQGVIYVAVQNGYELEELHNVAISSPSTGQVLRYNAATGLWENAEQSITPAALVTAAEGMTSAQEADMRDALELLPRDLHLRGLQNTIDIASSFGAIPISIIQLGDSFSDFAVFNRSARVVGAFRCAQATAGGDSGVTPISDDYTRSPDGRYSQIASGGNLTAAHLTSGTQGPASHVHYTFFPGTGTAQLQFSNNGGAWTNVGSAINTAAITGVSVGSIALPNAWQNVRTRVTATGGTVNGWIGQGLSGPGITLMNFGVTGQGVQQSATVSEAIWKAMVAGYQWAGGAEIVFVTFADARFAEGASGSWAKGAPLWSQNGPLDTLYQWSKTANSTVDWMVVGPHQVDPTRNDTPDATLDPLYAALGIGLSTNERITDGARAQRDWAILRSEGFVDCIPLFPNYAAANADGMYDDQIHVSAKGESYKRAWVWRSSNMGFVLGDAGYNSSIRVGDGYLVILAGRATGALPQVAGVSSAAVPSLLPGVFAELRSGDPVAPEQAGLAFRCVSTNVGRISTYNQASHTDLLEYTLSGASPLIQPLTGQTIGNATLQTLLGTTSRRYADLVTAGLNVGHRAVTAASVTVVQADYTIFANATSNAITVNLPSAASHAGRVFAVVKTDASANAVTLDPNASETINGAATLALPAQWDRCQIQSNGSNWIRIA